MIASEQWLSGFHPAYQALFATLFTWGVTAFGAVFVFFFKTFNQKWLDAMMGFAAGVMFVVIESWVTIPDRHLPA